MHTSFSQLSVQWWVSHRSPLTCLGLAVSWRSTFLTHQLMVRVVHIQWKWWTAATRFSHFCLNQLYLVSLSVMHIFLNSLLFRYLYSGSPVPWGGWVLQSADVFPVSVLSTEPQAEDHSEEPNRAPQWPARLEIFGQGQIPHTHKTQWIAFLTTKDPSCVQLTFCIKTTKLTGYLGCSWTNVAYFCFLVLHICPPYGFSKSFPGHIHLWASRTHFGKLKWWRVKFKLFF